ncbi:hypothetical protein NHX12_023264 [Muraenolepis orangiensis]|uniref:Endonuclease/exonuclease/phosphatase domain-containing protein n=1 Tax=Muraenolepis orangiensis TaxID=630683 RepID=A0A9Q0EK21_9TELE|nr:hypothetical protein NHX12_023264 [Muraenolepis orangiensis]
MDTVRRGKAVQLSVMYSGHEEDGANPTEGVAIMMTKETRKALIAWEPISSRLITASFRTNNRRVKAHIIQCYAPTNHAVDDVKARFYDSLNHLLGRVGARDLIILMGDFNAKIGGRNEGYEEVKGKHGVGKMNENGEMFVETCVNNNLVIGGSVFPHKTIHKTTSAGWHAARSSGFGASDAQTRCKALPRTERHRGRV